MWNTSGECYVKLYRYNPKHLYPKLNGYGDNGQRSLKLWQLLHTYWLPNTYWKWEEYVVSVMLISVLNIKVTSEWHKAIKLNYKNTRSTAGCFTVPSTLHIWEQWSTVLSRWAELVRRKTSQRTLLTQSRVYWEGWLHCTLKVNGLTAVEVQYAEMQDVHTFLWPLSP